MTRINEIFDNKQIYVKRWLITSYELVKITEAFEGKMDEIEKSDFGLFEMNDKVAEIAKRNGFTLSTAHHKKDPGGLAWGLP